MAIVIIIIIIIVIIDRGRVFTSEANVTRSHAQ